MLYMKEALDQTIWYSNSASVAFYLRKLVLISNVAGICEDEKRKINKELRTVLVHLMYQFNEEREDRAGARQVMDYKGYNVVFLGLTTC